jgi:DNA-binding response OmpR family regulator
MDRRLRVLIVEDEILIALDVESALVGAGHYVCGIASSETQAIRMAMDTQPDCAVVDVRLGPGDGRVVARALAGEGVAVLFATGQCAEVESLSATGGLGCLPKPYKPEDVPAAISAVVRRQRGDVPGDLPDDMFLLDAA